MIRCLHIFIALLLSMPLMAVTHTVHSKWDKTPGSLRDMVSKAKPGDVIDFSILEFPPGKGCDTIVLESELVIDKDLTIEGISFDGKAHILIKVPVTAREAALTGATASAHRLLRISGSNTKVKIANLLFQGGDISEVPTATGSHGGAIYVTDAAVSFENITISDTKAAYGGAIYNNGRIHLTNDSLFHNEALNDGGGVYNTRSLYLCNTLLYGNKAQNGGAIANHKADTLVVTNGTLTGNRAIEKGGAVYGNWDDLKLFIALNTIFTGNTNMLSNKENNLTLAWGKNYMAYCIYGTDDDIDDIDNMWKERFNTKASALAVFAANSTMPLQTGAAAGAGTLTGRFGEHYYYCDRNNGLWESFTYPFLFAFEPSHKNTYGFVGGVFTVALNGVSRVQRFDFYNTGAYALDYKTPGLVVTCNGDLTGLPGVRTLREAIAYAGSAAVNYASTITFDPAVFKPGNNAADNTIVLNNELCINKNITIEGPTDNGKAFVRIKTPVTAREATTETAASDYRILNIHGYEAHISNLLLKGGDISGRAWINGCGGVILGRNADIMLRNISVSDTRADRGGAICHHGGKLYLENDSFYHNSTVSAGSALSCFLDSVYINHSVFTGNRAEKVQGAISTDGLLDIRNSVLKNNSGGAINSSGEMYLENDSLIDNHTLGYDQTLGLGGAIDNFADGIIVNCVFSGNKAAKAGDAIYTAFHRLILIGSTFKGNGIVLNESYSTTHHITEVTAFNCIFTGNDPAGTRKNIAAVPGNILNMAYCVYGADGDTDHITGNVGNTKAPAGMVFAGNGTELLPEGQAARAGTLVGRLKDDFYYRDMNDHKWKSFTSSNGTFAFDAALAGYGLGADARIFETALNGVSRVLTHDFYNAGAYALAYRVPLEVTRITVSGATYEPDNDLYVTDCGRTGIEVTVETADKRARVMYHGREGKSFTVDLAKEGFHTVNFTVAAPDYSTAKEYSLRVERRFEFDKVVVTRWNNTLTVINDAGNNGGFTFTSFRWFRNGQAISTEQSISAGENGEPVGGTGRYYVALTATGYPDTLRTCESTPAIQSATAKAWPSPAARNETIFVETEAAKAPGGIIMDIVNMQGESVRQKKITDNVTPVRLPVPGIYIIRLRGKPDYMEYIKIVVE